MRVIGKMEFSLEAESGEVGGKRAEGDYKILLTGQDMPLQTDVRLLKNASAQAVGLGGLTTVTFIHAKVVFDGDSVAVDYTDTIELILNGETFTGREFLIVGGDFTTIALTNNTDDATGKDATVLIEMLGV